MRNKRKLKIKDFEEAVKQQQDSQSSGRAKLLKDHGTTNPGLRKQKTIVGVMPEDISKKEFQSHSITGSDSGLIGPDGKKISYSYEGDNDRSLLYDLMERPN